jgi:hypothetical protein
MMWAVGIFLDAPLFDDDFGFTQRVENLPIETYMDPASMDPASAQGYLSILRIGCLHISGLLLG